MIMLDTVYSSGWEVNGLLDGNSRLDGLEGK